MSKQPQKTALAAYEQDLRDANKGVAEATKRQDDALAALNARRAEDDLPPVNTDFETVEQEEEDEESKRAASGFGIGPKKGEKQ